MKIVWLLLYTQALIPAILTIVNKAKQPLVLSFRGKEWSQQRYLLAGKTIAVDSDHHAINSVHYKVREPYKSVDASRYYRIPTSIPEKNVLGKITIFPSGQVVGEDIERKPLGAMRMRQGYFIPSDMDC